MPIIPSITLNYTEPLVRAAVLAFWRRTVGTGFFVSVVALAGSMAFLAWRGDRSWFVGALGGFLAFALISATAVYVVHLRGAMARFRGMGAPSATLAMDDDGFTMSSGLGSTTLKWSAITEVWRCPAFWLVLFSKSQFVTLPTDALTNEARTFLIGRVWSAGGKVVD